MFILYLDASGSANRRDATGHYVLAGLCMRDGSWFALDKRIRGFKHRYALQGTEFELHVKNFACTIQEQGEIANFESLTWNERHAKVTELRNRKLSAELDRKKRRFRRDRYKETQPFIHLSRAERSQLLEDAISLVSSHNGIRLFAEAIDKRHPQVVSGSVEPVRQAFEQVVARFDTFLRKKNSWKQEANPRAMIDYGLLMLDRDPSTESSIDRLFRRFRDHGHSYGQLTHVIDVPIFASSDKVGGLQLVDVCAYVVRRYLDLDAAQRPGSHQERQFDALFPKFDRDTHGRLHGLRHYVAAGTCSCRICQDRGHSPVP